MITRSQLVLVIAKTYSLSPNFVDKELADIEANLPKECPDIGTLYKWVLEIKGKRGVNKLTKGLGERFNSIRIVGLIKDYAREAAKGTHMSPEQVEAYFISSEGETSKDRKKKSQAFIDNLAFAAMNNHRKKMGQ